ncbi:hypothetical protein O4H52_01175 [Sphingomonadaceae bacterium G21617-S1]|nr:hypothetical protein [Sphingomonadaceae bacterium G21617-S1]
MAEGGRAVTEEEQSAYRAGWLAATPEDPAFDRIAFNPHDADDEPTLYEAWERGNDDRHAGRDELGTAMPGGGRIFIRRP